MRVKLLISALLMTFIISVQAQNSGDYRSRISGAWTTAATWQTFNGLIWVTATTYPGQNTSTASVLIRNGHTLTMGTNNVYLNQTGIITVSGQLNLNGVNVSPGSTFSFNTPSIIVTAIPAGRIQFDNKVKLMLPENASIQVSVGGLVGDCNHTQQIFIGTFVIAYCRGGGSSALTFQELMEIGGSIHSVITTSPITCSSTSATITGSYLGSRYDFEVTTSWKVVDPLNNTFYPTGDSFELPLDLNGVYNITYTCTINYFNNYVTNSNELKIPNAVSTWTGSWNPVPPTELSKVRIAANYDTALNGSFSACSLNIEAGKTMQIAPNTYLEVENNIVNNGAMVVESSGSLIQKENTATFTGNPITIKRISRPMRGLDYVYWGSPIAESYAIPAAFDKKYRWNLTGAQEGAWVSITTPPPVGNGFIARVSQAYVPVNASPKTIEFPFVGLPNSGPISVYANVFDGGDVNTDSGNSILLANPYPSAIEANALLLQHPQIVKLLFWTSVTVYTGTGQYQVADYATWNLSGGTKPLSSTDESLTPKGYIASGQGFFAQVTADANITFNNSMRIKDNNTQFYRTAQPVKENSETEKHRLWINLSNNKDAYRQMMVGYIEGATNALDTQYDGSSFTQNEIDIYTILGKEQLAIQGRALPFNPQDIIPLGFKVTNEGKYTLALGHSDGLFSDYKTMVVKDKLTNNYQNLNEGSYTFDTKAGTFNNRFELYFTEQNSTETITQLPNNDCVIWSAEKQIHINSTGFPIESVEVYDVFGTLIWSQTGVKDIAVITNQLNTANPFLIVKVTDANRQVITKKIIFK